MKRPLIVILLIFIASLNVAFREQRMFFIDFQGMMGEKPLLQQEKWKCPKNDSLCVDVCRFYVSDVAVMSGDKVLGTMKYHLVDIFDSTARRITVLIGEGEITGIRFNLGIDSATNVAGVGEGPLDPTRGMYWTWQSGYINMKLEGKCNSIPVAHGEFQFHLGGYAGANYSMQKIALATTADHATIGVDVNRFFSGVTLTETPHIMSPSPKAVGLSGIAAQMFYVK